MEHPPFPLRQWQQERGLKGSAALEHLAGFLLEHGRTHSLKYLANIMNKHRHPGWKLACLMSEYTAGDLSVEQLKEYPLARRDAAQCGCSACREWLMASRGAASSSKKAAA